LPQIGDLDHVAQHEVAVEAQQRVAVEEQRRDAADQHHVEGEGAYQPGLDIDPDDHRQRRQRQLDHDTGTANHRAAPFLGKGGGGRGVDIGYRDEDEEHHPDLVHLAAPGLGGIGVAQLVHRLDQREGQRHQQEVLGREHPVDHPAEQLVGMQDRQRHPGQHQRQPHDEAPDGENRTHQRHGAVEEGVGVEERQTHRQRVAQPGDQGLSRLIVVTAAHLGDVRGHVAGDQVGAMQLGQQADHLGLGRRVVLEPGAGRLPERLHGASPVHQRQHQVRRRAQPVIAPRVAVLHHEPGLAAKALPVDIDMAAQPRP